MIEKLMWCRVCKICTNWIVQKLNPNKDVVVERCTKCGSQRLRKESIYD